MKLKNSFLALAVALAATGGVSSVAHADLLTYFNFNDSTVNPTAGQAGAVELNSDGGAQSTSIDISRLNIQTNPGPTGGIGSFTGTTNNAIENPAATTNRDFRVIGSGNNNSSFQFRFNTLSYENAVLTFANQRSGTAGTVGLQVSYSTDNNIFTNFGTAFDPTNANSTRTFDFSSIDALDNQANVYLRFGITGLAANNSTIAFDNIQVNASAITTAPVPEPSTIALFVIGLGGMGFAMRRKKSADAAAGDSALVPC